MTSYDGPGLVRLDFGNESFGLYWMQMVDGVGGDRLVVITCVDGSPGPSPVNRIEDLATQLSTRLPDDRPIRWITNLDPALDAFKQDQFVEAMFADTFEAPTWKRWSRTQIESAIVGHLSKLPEDLHEQVLAAGGIFDEERRYTYRVVSVESLPAPADLFRCRYADEFSQAKAAHPQDSGAAAQQFYENLTVERAAICRYHAMDWVTIANAAVEIVERLGACPDKDEIAEALRSSELPAAEQWMLESLFGSDAIALTSEGRYFNGQHRGCGLRLSGADRVVVAGP